MSELSKMTDKQLNERIAEHTCHGAIFCGAPVAVAQAECPVCSARQRCEWEHVGPDFDGSVIGFECGAFATHRLLIEDDRVEPVSTVFVCAEHRDAIIDDLRDCGDARVVDDALLGE